MAHKCAHCGAGNASFGFRLPGLASQIPAKYHAPVWACGAAACKAAIRARRDRFMVKIGAKSSARRVAGDADQGVLL